MEWQTWDWKKRCENEVYFNPSENYRTVSKIVGSIPTRATGELIEQGSRWDSVTLARRAKAWKFGLESQP